MSKIKISSTTFVRILRTIIFYDDKIFQLPTFPLKCHIFIFIHLSLSLSLPVCPLFFSTTYCSYIFALVTFALMNRQIGRPSFFSFPFSLSLSLSLFEQTLTMPSTRYAYHLSHSLDTLPISRAKDLSILHLLLNASKTLQRWHCKNVLWLKAL